MHERSSNDPPLVLDHESVSDPLIRSSEHPIDGSETFRVTLRAVEVRFEHDMKGIIKESLGDNACHLRDISTRGKSTLHRAPPQLVQLLMKLTIENLTLGRYLSYYVTDRNLTLSIRAVYL